MGQTKSELGAQRPAKETSDFEIPISKLVFPPQSKLSNPQSLGLVAALPVLILFSTVEPLILKTHSLPSGKGAALGSVLATRARSQSLKLDELPTSQQRQHYGVSLEISKPGNRLSNPGNDVEQKQN